MRLKFQALSIVQPSGRFIVQGIKRLEIRSWQPELTPLKNLVIVEYSHYLNQDGDEEQVMAVATVDIESIHAWQENEVEPARTSTWSEGYIAWVITHVRPIEPPIPVPAQRKIYLIEIDHI